MAALVAGVQYGLSSHNNFHENKSLIFVKLTDSAQRAIEDFLKNRNKTSQNPTIQFSGNEGQLSFPSSQSSHGSAGFTFTLSGNQDMEGPQGSFECIQQAGHRSLQNLGALPCKMRIQANDDVYEATRHRMAAVDQNNKTKCTRVIKASGPDIGRKVKVKSTGRTIPPPPATSRHRETTSIPSSMSQSSRLIPSSAMPRSHAMFHSSSQATTNSSSSPSYKSISNNNPLTRHQPEKKNSELCRRPLRERLIHVLALRPYKKPELYDRLNREGLKDRERSAITNILKQITSMKDNAYVLQRHVWNDVQEDWPFYTEQDRATLKRRKPQNLTPPGSSDCSSGSGTSPNSTHPGSPPAIIAPPPNLKRPGYHQGSDGITTKRLRISHYRKPEPSSVTGGSSANRENIRTPNISSDNVMKNENDWDVPRHQQRERTDNRPERSTNSETNSGITNNQTNTNYARNKSSTTPTSDVEEVVSARYNQEISTSSAATSRNQLQSNYKMSVSDNSDFKPATSGSYRASPVGNGGRKDDRGRNDKDREQRKEREQHDKREQCERDNSASGTKSYNEFTSAGTPSLTVNNTTPSLSSPTVTSGETEEPPTDWAAIYPPISTPEEKIRYKAIWSREHPYYMEMYDQIAKEVTLIHRLNALKEKELEKGNKEKAKAISQQIHAQYYHVRSDHAIRRKKYNELHAKLTQIKDMVEDWDIRYMNSEDTGNCPYDDHIRNDDRLRY
ncbi:RNA polymerase II elongation factor Ell [Diachasma alloeum]|uniref:RNA polymerase II elongation factor Ell n=1 Tax=Diachasma alloeum TaxID=454923 RepID=UPI000738378C|nr:RNA polymerase II elongation factor Ell [Diachasma alloeum]